MDNNTLKYNGQCSKLTQTLVMLTILLKYLSSLTMSLKCFHKILSSLGADELLYSLIAIINFFLEKEFYGECCLDGRFSNKNSSNCWLWTKLNVRWRAFQRSSILIYGYLLNWIISMAGRFCFLTQFIKFHSLQFFDVISWILSSKNDHFVLFTIFLKSF